MVNVGKGNFAGMTRTEITAHKSMNLLVSEIRILGIDLINAAETISRTEVKCYDVDRRR